MDLRSALRVTVTGRSSLASRRRLTLRGAAAAGFGVAAAGAGGLAASGRRGCGAAAGAAAGAATGAAGLGAAAAAGAVAGTLPGRPGMAAAVPLPAATGRRRQRRGLQRRRIDRFLVGGALRIGVDQRRRGAQLDPEINHRADRERAKHAHRDEERQARIRLLELGLEHASARWPAPRRRLRSARFACSAPRRRARAGSRRGAVFGSRRRRLVGEPEFQRRGLGAPPAATRRCRISSGAEMSGKLVARRDVPAIVEHRRFGVERRGLGGRARIARPWRDAARLPSPFRPS